MMALPIYLLLICLCAVNSEYFPTWDSLNSRPLPKWYDQSKFGIFMYWGVYYGPVYYSVPSFGSEWFWHSWKTNSSEYVQFMKENYPGTEFLKAELFDPKSWAELFVKAGAKY